MQWAHQKLTGGSAKQNFWESSVKLLYWYIEDILVIWSQKHVLNKSQGWNDAFYQEHRFSFYDGLSWFIFKMQTVMQLICVLSSDLFVMLLQACSALEFFF